MNGAAHCRKAPWPGATCPSRTRLWAVNLAEGSRSRRAGQGSGAGLPRWQRTARSCGPEGGAERGKRTSHRASARGRAGGAERAAASGRRAAGCSSGGRGSGSGGRARPSGPAPPAGRGRRRGAMAPPEEVWAQLARCGQSHLLRFWAELGPAQRAALLAALPPGLGEHCRLAAAAGARQRGPPERLDGRMEPLPGRLLGSARRSGPAALERWEAEGERGEGPPAPCRGWEGGVRGSGPRFAPPALAPSARGPRRAAGARAGAGVAGASVPALPAGCSTRPSCGLVPKASSLVLKASLRGLINRRSVARRQGERAGPAGSGPWPGPCPAARCGVGRARPVRIPQSLDRRGERGCSRRDPRGRAPCPAVSPCGWQPSACAAAPCLVGGMVSGSGEVSPSQGWQRGWQGGERFGVTAAPPGPGSRQPAAWGAAGSVEVLWG